MMATSAPLAASHNCVIPRPEAGHQKSPLGTEPNFSNPIGDLISRNLALARDVPDENPACERRGCNATSVGAERRAADDFAVSNSAISRPATSQRCALASPPPVQKVHIVRTEHREGRRVLVRQIGRQDPVDIPEPGGPIV